MELTGQLTRLVAYGVFAGQRYVLNTAIPDLPQAARRLPDFPNRDDRFAAAIEVLNEAIARISTGGIIFVRGGLNPKWEKQLRSDQIQDALRTLLELPESGEASRIHQPADERRDLVIRRLRLTAVTDAVRFRKLGPEDQLMSFLSSSLLDSLPDNQPYQFREIQFLSRVNRRGVITSTQMMAKVRSLGDPLERIGPIAAEHLSDPRPGIMSVRPILKGCRVEVERPYGNRSLIRATVIVQPTQRDGVVSFGIEIQTDSDVAHPSLIQNRCARGLRSLEFGVEFEESPPDVWRFGPVALDSLIPESLPSEDERLKPTGGQYAWKFTNCLERHTYGIGWSPL